MPARSPDELDEEEAAVQRRRLVERFARWLDDNPEFKGAEADDLELVLRWKWAYADGDLTWWTRQHVDEVLLDHLPRSLSASPERASSYPSSIAAFVHFLAAQGWSHADSDPAAVVANRALAQERAFADAMADPGKFGMTKRILSSVGIDFDDDLPDQAALHDAMERFNALSFEERGAILGIGDRHDDQADALELLPLPFRAVASQADVDRTAVDVPLLRQVDALHAALGPDGIKLTKAGNPTLADARRLVEATGTGESTEGVRSSAHLRELFVVGQVAQEAEAVEAVDGRLRASAAWASMAPSERWERVVDAVLALGPATLRFGAVAPNPWDLAELADEGAVQFLGMLWATVGGMTTDELAEVLHAAIAFDRNARTLFLFSAEWRQAAARHRAEGVVRSLRECGVVHVDDAGTVTLADVGARLVAPWLTEAGFDVVLPDAVADLSASELLDVLVERDDDPAALASAWLVGRDRPSAAGEVVSQLLTRPDRLRVVVGFTVLDMIGEDAVDAVRSALDTTIAPHAWLFLAAMEAVDVDDVPPAAVTRAGIDLFLTTAEAGAPADAVELLVGRLSVAEQEALVDTMANSDHPDAGALLELFGRHHPVKEVGKHARKAAHRWRSVHGGGLR